MDMISISRTIPLALLCLCSCAGAPSDEAPLETEEATLELGFGIPTSLSCDKVTTYVCPGDDCLCKQKNCDPPLHNGDYAPCSGPPVAGCEHDFLAQFCFPFGAPINCSAAGVPVNRCAIPCRSGGVTYTLEPNGCCRGERECLNPRVAVPQPIDISHAEEIPECDEGR